jgi:hypothetical protein
VAGAALIVLVMVIVGPIAVMLAGAVWAALFGWMVGDDAEQPSEPSAEPAA